jgi:hypothetical protein
MHHNAGLMQSRLEISTTLHPTSAHEVCDELGCEPEALESYAGSAGPVQYEQGEATRPHDPPWQFKY